MVKIRGNCESAFRFFAGLRSGGCGIRVFLGLGRHGFLEKEVVWMLFLGLTVKFFDFSEREGVAIKIFTQFWPGNGTHF